MATTPFWRKIHQTVSGYNQTITDSIVADVLTLSKTELVEGLLKYKTYTKASYSDWAKSATVTNYTKEFVIDISKDLNLDVGVAYLVLCNYLMFEYYGKIKEFWEITKIGITSRLKESIWYFYTSERMFLLKTWRHILEFVADDNYEFSTQYHEFLDSVDLTQVQNNLIKQFEMLLNESIPRVSNEHCKYLDNWSCRNNREKTEIVTILTLTIKHGNFDENQILRLFKLFLKNNFNMAPAFMATSAFANSKDKQQIVAAQVGCFFALLESYWTQDLTDFWKNPLVAEVNKSVLDVHSSVSQTVVALAWILLKSKGTGLEQDEDLFLNILNSKPFASLDSIVRNEIFKNCRFGEIALKGIHKMIDELCLMFVDRTVLYEEESFISVASKFLTQPELAETCLQTRNGLDSVLEIAIETFPYDFYSLSSIFKSLLGQKSHYKKTIHLLNNIPSFLSEMTWSIPKEEIYVLKAPQPALQDSDLIMFAPGTAVKSYAVFGQNLVQYKGTYSYFLYLEYLVNLLIEDGTKNHKFDENLVKKVLAGYGVVEQGIKYCVDMDLKVIGLERIFQKLNKILTYLDGSLLHFDLVKMYFDIHNAMMAHRNTNFFDNCPEIVWKIFFPRIKTHFLGQKFQDLLFNHYIFEDTILMKLFKEEEFRDDHSLLLTYIEILYNIIRVKFQYKTFQLSGIAYLINMVFLQHRSWAYKEETQKTQITLGCLKIFHYVLQKNPEDLNDVEKQIFYLCDHAFLNNGYFVESFLKLFIGEKYHLIFVMENETNWIKGSSLEELSCVRMQLALLLLVMSHRQDSSKSCVLSERLSFVVKPIASYFTNAYSPIIAELSCRFLEKHAQDEQAPLLALLELDHYQVQSLFLERLRDPLEDENVKLAIIDLINACIATQNGMTAAFFNLKCFMYWDGTGTETDFLSGDTVSDFMVDYLQNVKKSHEYFKNPLQLGILRLLYNLWLNHRENLIDNISNLKDFWPVMMDPFFCDFVQEVDVYTVILKIVNLEISIDAENVGKNLIATIDKFFKNREQLNACIDYVLEDSTGKDNVEMLSAWMEFLILAKKVMPEKFDDNSKTTLIVSCLNGLNILSSNIKDIEIVYLWAQLYFVLTSAWSVSKKNQSVIIKKLTNFLTALSAHYKHLTLQIKELTLCIIVRTIEDFHEYFGHNTLVLMSFLLPLGTIIDSEHEYLVSEIWHLKDNDDKVNQLKAWLLIIFIGNSLLSLGNVEEIALWFSYRRLLQHVMDSVRPMLETRATLPFAKIAIDYMITHAASPLAKDFLTIDFFDFYYNMRPPGLTIAVGDAILYGVPIDLKEWWLIFATLIKLNRTLIETLEGALLKTCFAFVTQHDEPLKEIVCLSKFTVDKTALILVRETLKFIHTLLCVKPFWYVEAPHSYEVIMEGVKTTFNACVLALLGSKKINFYNVVHGKKLNIIPSPSSELLASVLNQLIEIIFWGSCCLRKVKPSLTRFFDHTLFMEMFPLLVDNDFSVPRFELPITSRLTYGMLLCLAHYLCKTLNQLSPETPTIPPQSHLVSMTGLEDQFKQKGLGEIFEYCTATYEKHIGFMVYMQKTDDLQSEKLTSFLHYDMSEFSSSSTSAVVLLDYNLVKNALDALMTFLAGEIWFTIEFLGERNIFSYKRELCSEMQFFYEFVRKRTSELHNAMVRAPHTVSLQNEADIVRNYMVTTMKASVDEVIEKNFALVISQWLVKLCELSN